MRLKYYITALFILLALGSVWTCKEVPPAGLDLTARDTTLIDTTYVVSNPESPQTKRVFIEEFTGVRCVNCPTAHKELQKLDSIYGKNIVILSIHEDDIQAKPYPFSDEDFKTTAGADIESLVGPISGYPAGDVDRFHFSGESEVIIGNIANWSTYVKERSNLIPPVNVYINDTFIQQKRDLEVEVTLHYTQEITADTRLSVALIENKIIDPQLTPSGVDTFYEHQHVLRGMLTPYNGIKITAQQEPGRVVKKGFRKRGLPNNWNINNCHVVGFLHETGDSLNVLQAAEIAIQ